LLQSNNQEKKTGKIFLFEMNKKGKKTVGKLSADSDRVYELQAATPREKRIGERTESTQLLLPRPAPSSASAPPSPLRSSDPLLPLPDPLQWRPVVQASSVAGTSTAPVGWLAPLSWCSLSVAGRTRGTTSLEPGESCLYRSTNNKCSRMRGRLDSGQCCGRPFRETFCCASYLTAGSRLPACARRGRETQTPRLFHRGCCLTSTAAAPAVVSFRGGSLS
jgi:hypothetical protein